MTAYLMTLVQHKKDQLIRQRPLYTLPTMHLVRHHRNLKLLNSH